MLINKTFGCARYVYNYYLDKMQKEGYTYAYTNISDYVNNLKYNALFLQEIDSIVIRKSNKFENNKQNESALQTNVSNISNASNAGKNNTSAFSDTKEQYTENDKTVITTFDNIERDVDKC